MVNKIIKEVTNRKHFKFIATFTLSFILACILILFLILSKPVIQDATANDLKEINGIGVIKAAQIEKFYDLCPEASIQDAERLDGIGEITVQKLKEKYR